MAEARGLDAVDDRSLDKERQLLPPEQHGDTDASKIQIDQPKTRSPPPSPPQQPEIDGGMVGWLCVAGSWLVMMNTWGWINTFGTFQTIYIRHIIPEYDNSSIAWIGSIQPFFLFMGAVVVGRLCDAGYTLHCTVLGSILLPLATLMISFSSTYYQIFLSHGLATGIACGLAYTPALTSVATWFTKRRSFVLGITASGSSVGGVIYPIMITRLMESIGFNWAVRVACFIQAVCSVFAIFTIKRKPGLVTPGPLLDLGAFKEIPYVLLVVGVFLSYFGLYYPFYFLPQWVITRFGQPEVAGSYVLIAMNAASTLGRILPNFIADYSGPFNMLAPCTVSAGLLTLCWLGIDNLAGNFVYAVLYGFASGTFVSLPPAAISSMSEHNVSKIGTRYGMAFFIISFAVLIGTPIGGAIHSKGYAAGVVFSGVVTLLGGMFIVLARIILTGLTLCKKA